MPVKIAPSILDIDFARLGDEIARVEPHVDLLHLDVMDGHFVPNLSFGMPVIASLRKVTTLPFHCHLMVTNPVALFGPLAEAGATTASIHIEVHPDPTLAAEAARAEGLGFGLVINPATPVAAVAPFIELCDVLLVMSVVPGFGGQIFMLEVLPKVEEIRKLIDSSGLATDIEIDGGITPETIGMARRSGANVFVAGTAIFKSSDPVDTIARLRAAAEEGS